MWCFRVETSLSQTPVQDPMEKVEAGVKSFLSLLAETVLNDLPKEIRQKYEQIITDFVHQRDVTRYLIKMNTCSPKDFNWLYYMRLRIIEIETDPLKRLQIQMGNANFLYGFEYLGVGVILPALISRKNWCKPP